MAKKKSSKNNEKNDGNGNGKKRQSAEEFVKNWQSAKSLDDLMQKTGSTRLALSSRAANYRKRGIEMRKFPSGHKGPRIDVAVLSALAKEYAPIKV